ncbi:thioredoxin family protein [Macrococcus armenti]|uniref:thioredoxin family protein n=1 Tax=Macrococcus armenti TaxID=2875764 RepID=UPI001CC9AC81|nr:thioredoxin family protein [Macrococcus armenti]UBH13721.1 thioredoxin family protein [Macrococcus armenti]
MSIRTHLQSKDLTGLESDFIIFGYTPFCGTCKLAEKMLDIANMTTQCKVLKLDLNYYESLCETYKISSVPVLLVIKDDSVVKTVFKFESVTSIYEILTNTIDE